MTKKQEKEQYLPWFIWLDTALNYIIFDIKYILTLL